MNRKVLLAGAAVVVPILAVLAANIGRDPHRVETPMIGRVAPDFTLREVGTNREVTLASLRGKPVLLNFWATWCVPCLSEHPVLQAGAAASGGDIQFVGVVFDDEEPKILKFMKENGSRYPNLFDNGGRTAIAYGVTGVPESFFIGRDGKIVDKFDGPLDPDSLRSRINLVSR